MKVEIKYDTLRCRRRLAVKGWHQTNLAERCSLSIGVVSNFFNGIPISNENAKTIITKLGLPMEEIVILGNEKTTVQGR